jgi:hypothetical protein
MSQAKRAQALERVNSRPPGPPSSRQCKHSLRARQALPFRWRTPPPGPRRDAGGLPGLVRLDRQPDVP